MPVVKSVAYYMLYCGDIYADKGQCQEFTFSALIFPKDVPWHVYSISMPGSQYAGGRPVTSSPQEAIEEAEALLAHVWKETGQPVVIFGWSLGSSLAAAVAAASPLEHVRCLIMGNPFTSFKELALHLVPFAYPYSFLLDDWPTAEWASRVRAPTITLSSLNDELIPKSMHTEVSRRSGATRKKLFEINARHMQVSAFASANETIRSLCVSQA